MTACLALEPEAATIPRGSAAAGNMALNCDTSTAQGINTPALAPQGRPATPKR